MKVITSHTRRCSVRFFPFFSGPGGAAACRPGTHRVPHPDPGPPQGGAGLPRLLCGSPGRSPGWLCSGKHTYCTMCSWVGKYFPLLPHSNRFTQKVIYCFAYVNWLMHLSVSPLLSPRCFRASWIPSCSCAPFQPATSAPLTWQHTWSTPSMWWRRRWLSSSSPIRGWRCWSSRFAHLLSISVGLMLLGIK